MMGNVVAFVIAIVLYFGIYLAGAYGLLYTGALVFDYSMPDMPTFLLAMFVITAYTFLFNAVIKSLIATTELNK